jgi:hypothetical protein
LLDRGKGPSVSDEEASDASPNETSSAVLRESARLQVAEKIASRVVRQFSSYLKAEGTRHHLPRHRPMAASLFCSLSIRASVLFVNLYI